MWTQLLLDKLLKRDVDTVVDRFRLLCPSHEWKIFWEGNEILERYWHLIRCWASGRVRIKYIAFELHQINFHLLSLISSKCSFFQILTQQVNYIVSGLPKLHNNNFIIIHYHYIKLFYNSGFLNFFSWILFLMSQKDKSSNILKFCAWFW